MRCHTMLHDIRNIDGKEGTIEPLLVMTLHVLCCTTLLPMHGNESQWYMRWRKHETIYCCKSALYEVAMAMQNAFVMMAMKNTFVATLKSKLLLLVNHVSYCCTSAASTYGDGCLVLVLRICKRMSSDGNERSR